MEFATAFVGRMKALPRWAVVSIYLAFIALAEVLVAIPGGANPNAGPYQEYGLTLHILLVFALLFHAVYVNDRDRALAVLLTSLSLAPLIRIFSLAVPHFDFTILQWLALVSVPLLVAVASVAYVQGLRLRDLGLGFHDLEEVPVQIAIGLTGLPLGFVEYFILSRDPSWGGAWITTQALLPFLGGALAIFVGTGLSEELIFRGVLLRRAIEGLGTRSGVLMVTLVFASLHIFFRDPLDLAFVLGVGLFYAVAVVRTKSLWGPIVSHTLGNVMLYLVAPFLFPLVP